VTKRLDPLNDWHWKIICAGQTPDFAMFQYCEDGIWIRWKRSRWTDFIKYPRSELANCDLCGKLSGKTKLRYASLRVLTRDWVDRYFPMDCCIACLGRVSAINRKADDYLQTKSLIGRLQRARPHVRAA
jgi:hypothetical protein